MTSKRREPDFFVVGASRAGTTSLWHYLVEHPEVYMPRRSMAEKEPSFFCAVTPRWARAYRTKEAYLELFAEATGEKAVGESSTPYLVASEAPGRIRAAYPDAKIVIVLRQPADRAFSLYRFLCAVGAEWAPTFERALELEAERMHDDAFTANNPTWFGLYQYFHSGLYAEQVERYLDVFPRSQVEVVLFDDLATDPVAATQRVYRFLGVDSSFVPRVEQYNASGFPLSVRAQYWLGHDADRSASGGRTGGMGPLRYRLFTTNVRLGRFWDRPYRPLTRARLLDDYRDDIARTAALIGRSLDAWQESGDSTAS